MATSQRDEWGSRLEFLLSLIGMVVGLNNIWRFPYVTFTSGGGIFLIPYLLIILVVGLPMFTVEAMIGQYARMGPVELFQNMAPLFQGLGYVCIIACASISVYYNIILAWCINYLYESFTGLKWSNCDNEFNTPRCFCPTDIQSFSTNITNVTVEEGPRVASTEEFFHRHILRESDDLELPHFPMLISDIVAWVVVCVSLIKGIKSSGKVVYFTATFPYVLLFILLARAVTLPGAIEGLTWFLKPDMEKLFDLNVWTLALGQATLSLGIGMGIVITFGSYNKFHHPIMADAIILVIFEVFTSLLAGAVVFSIAGFTAHKMNTNLTSVISSGKSLAFVTLPLGLAEMPWPGPTVFSVLFFFMLFLVGIDSQYGCVETVASHFFDQLRRAGKPVNKPVIVSSLCFIFFILGLPLISGVGVRILDMINTYALGLPLVFVCFMESLIIPYVYGFQNLVEDYQEITQAPLGPRFRALVRIIYTVITPLLMTSFFMLNLWHLLDSGFHMKIDAFDSKNSSPWYVVIFCMSMSLLPLLAVPLGLLCYLRNNKSKNMKVGLRPLASYKENFLMNRVSKETKDLLEMRL